MSADIAVQPLIVIRTCAAGSVRSQGFQPWWYQARMA